MSSVKLDDLRTGGAFCRMPSVNHAFLRTGEILKSWGNLGKCSKKYRGNRGFECIKSRGNREMFLLVVDYL